MNTRVLELIKNPKIIIESDLNILESESEKMPYAQSIQSTLSLRNQSLQIQKTIKKILLKLQHTQLIKKYFINLSILRKQIK
jgi:hypothetical protein